MNDDVRTGEVGISDDALATIAGYSAVAGLCPLIPIPFVDDMIISRVHRRLCQVLCTSRGFYLSADNSKLLTSKPSNLLSGAVFTVLMWPVKKILRKLVYVLAIKSCADVATTVFDEGWLLARALEQQYVSHEAMRVGETATMERLRDAIFDAHKHVDPSATEQAMKSAFGVGREVFNSVLASMKGVLGSVGSDEERLDAAEHEAAPIADRIQDEIRKHWSNGPALDEALRAALEKPSQLTG